MRMRTKKLRSTISDLNEQLCNTVDRKEFDDLTNKYDQLNEKFETLDKNFKRMKKENETLNNTNEHCLENYNKLESKFEISKKENVELKSKLNELKNISKETFKDSTIKSDEIEQQHKIIAALQEENDSLKAHLEYLKEQNKKNVSIMSCGGDSQYSFNLGSQLSDSMINVPESMDIIVESKLRDCQKQLEETEAKLISKEYELNRLQEQLKVNQTELKSVQNEISSLEKVKVELNDRFKSELNEKENEINSLNQQISKLKDDFKTMKDSLLTKEQELKLTHEEMDKLRQSVEEESRLKEQLNELISKHREELDVINLQNEQKLTTLTSALSRQEEEELKIREQVDILKRLNEEKDNKLIDLESENERLNLDLNKYGEEINSINEYIDSTGLTQTEQHLLNELVSEKEAILIERNELEKQVKELRSALSQARDEYDLLAKKHQDEIFKLSEAMNKKQDDCKLRTDLQNILKCKENEIIQLKNKLEKKVQSSLKLI